MISISIDPATRGEKPTAAGDRTYLMYELAARRSTGAQPAHEADPWQDHAPCGAELVSPVALSQERE